MTELDWDGDRGKSSFENVMLKEIHQRRTPWPRRSPTRAVRETGVDFGEELNENLLRDANRIIIVACGTSYHSGGVFARYAIQNWAKVAVGCDIASEYRYSDPLVGPGDVVIGMTQSGRDRRHARRDARRRRRARR